MRLLDKGRLLEVLAKTGNNIISWAKNTSCGQAGNIDMKLFCKNVQAGSV